ncbi:MAG: pitrilysin family protein [Armatimonadota bacterium]
MSGQRNSAPVFACLVLIFVLIACAHAARVEVLDNGLTIAVDENHSAPVASVRFYVKVGSVYEGEYLGAGISHFVEHCVSEGTPTRTKEQIDEAIEALGNDSNAYTTSGHTCYYMNTAAQYVKDAAELIGDYVFHADFPIEAVKTQRGIIEREIARGDDEPHRRSHYLFQGTVFQQHPARHRVIGYEEQFNTLVRADLLKFHRQHYVPENVICVVVGDFDGEDIMAYLKHLFGDEPHRAVRRSALVAEPQQTTPRRNVVEDEGVNRAYMVMGWPTVDIFSPDLYALDVAAYILGNGNSSRLVRTLRDEKGLVDSISVYSDTPRYDAGTFAIPAVLAPENIQQAEEAIEAEVQRLATGDIDETELQKAKTQKAAEVIYRQETIKGRAELLGIDLLVAGDQHFTAQYIDAIKKVTADDIQRVAQKYFVDSHLNTSILRPPAEQTEAAAAPADTSTAQKSITTRHLDNGMFVVVQEAHHSPVVSMLAGFKGGVRYEPPGQNGLSNLTAQMLVRGTESRSYEDISNAVDGMASSLSAFSGRNTFGLQAQCTRSNFDETFDIFADCIANPAFGDEELARQKQLTVASIAARRDNVDATAHDLLSEHFYREHPYQRPVLGSEETVKNLARQDVVKFHSRYVRPNGMVLAIIGDIAPETTFTAVEERFADFEIGEITPPPISEEPEHAKKTKHTVHRDQKQAVVMYAFPGPTLGSDDRYARDVMTAAFAGMGMPGGRLHRTLRGAELVYATWAYAMPGIETGHYAIYAATAPEKVDLVTEALEGLIEKFVTEGPTDAELERGKKMANASTQLNLQGNLARAQKIVLDELYDLGFDNYLHYADNIENVTAGEVQNVARRLLDLSQSTVVIITPETSE